MEKKRRLARASGVVAGGECGSYPFTADGDDPRVDLPLARGAGCPVLLATAWLDPSRVRGWRQVSIGVKPGWRRAMDGRPVNEALK